MTLMTRTTTDTYNGGHFADEDPDRHLTATVVIAPDPHSGAPRQLVLVATGLIDHDRALQSAQNVAMTDMAQARPTDSAPLSESERRLSPLLSHLAPTPAPAFHHPALAHVASIFAL